VISTTYAIDTALISSHACLRSSIVSVGRPNAWRRGVKNAYAT
jgi:hypothetical protein